MQQEFNFEDYDFRKQIEEILEAAGADDISPPPDLAEFFTSFSHMIYLESIKQAPKDVDYKTIISFASHYSVFYTGLMAMSFALKYPATADWLQDFIPEKTLTRINAYAEAAHKALKNDRQVEEEEPQRPDPDCDICSKSVKLSAGAVWVKRNEVFSAQFDHNSNPETDEAIDMRKYSPPSQVHIYFGHVECQDDMQNSYAAETYLTNPSSLLNLSAHLFTKNWFKHSDYTGFAKEWSKRF